MGSEGGGDGGGWKMDGGSRRQWVAGRGSKWPSSLDFERNFWQRACIICGGHSGAVYELGFFRNETPLALAINIILNLI